MPRAHADDPEGADRKAGEDASDALHAMAGQNLKHSETELGSVGVCARSDSLRFRNAMEDHEKGTERDSTHKKHEQVMNKCITFLYWEHEHNNCMVRMPFCDSPFQGQ